MVAEVVGHRLAEIRRARGLMQQQVADRMGVSKGRITAEVQAEFASLGKKLEPIGPTPKNFELYEVKPASSQ